MKNQQWIQRKYHPVKNGESLMKGWNFLTHFGNTKELFYDNWQTKQGISLHLSIQVSPSMPSGDASSGIIY